MFKKTVKSDIIVEFGEVYSGYRLKEALKFYKESYLTLDFFFYTNEDSMSK